MSDVVYLLGENGRLMRHTYPLLDSVQDRVNKGLIKIVDPPVAELTPEPETPVTVEPAPAPKRRGRPRKVVAPVA